MQKFFILERAEPAKLRSTSPDLATRSWKDAADAPPDLASRSAGLPPAEEPGRIMVQDLTEKDAADAIRDDKVDAVAPVMPLRLIEPVPAAGSAAAQGNWGVAAVSADKSPYDGKGVKVAVLDTGIHATHPAFAKKSINQRDFTGSGDGDRQGHGTHCAGTIFGRSDPRIGVAPGVTEVIIGKVLGDSGGGSSEMLFSALHWAFEQRVNIISMSLGFDFPGMVDNQVAKGWPAKLATSMALEAYRANLRMFDALMAQAQAMEAFGGSPLIIAAAGNESRRGSVPEYKIAASLPAAANNVISVAALRQNGATHSVATFSNTMATLAAPGHDIVSAKTGGGFVALNGTSMACPHVAGVAALWWQSLGRSANASRVAARLLTSCRTDTLASVDRADVGEGLITAPLA